LITVRRLALAAVLLGLVSGGLAACKAKGAEEPAASSGSGDEAEPTDHGGPSAPGVAVNKRGGSSVTAVIGPSGGSLEIASGARIEISPGAFAEAQEITIADAPGSTAFLNSEHERPIGPVFTVAPAMDATERGNIRVSIPLASYPPGWGDVRMGFEYPTGNMVGGEDATHTKWQTEAAQLTGGRAVATVPALPGFRLQFVLTNLESQ
jgi:hypothetical protein